MLKKSNRSILSVILLFIVSTLLIGVFSGCLPRTDGNSLSDTTEHETVQEDPNADCDVLSEETALEIKQALHAVDQYREYYAAEDLTFRYCGRFNDCYVVLSPVMFYQGMDGSGFDRIDDVTFSLSCAYNLKVYHDGKLLGLRQAYQSDLLTHDDLQTVSTALEAVKEEDDQAYSSTYDPSAEPPGTLSAEKDLEIRQAHLNTINEKRRDQYTVDDFWINFCGEYNDAYVIWMNGTSVYYTALCVDIVHGVPFYYGSSHYMKVYRDGVFYDLQEAFGNGFLTVEDLQALQKVYRNSKIVFRGYNDAIPEATALEIKQALHTADKDKEYYAAEDLTFRYCGRFNDCYVVLSPVLFSYGISGGTYGKIDDVAFFFMSRYNLNVYHNSTLLGLQEAYDAGLLTHDDLQTVSTVLGTVREEDELTLYPTKDPNVQLPDAFSADKDLEIREAYLNTLDDNNKDRYSADDFLIASCGEYNGTYVMWMHGPYLYINLMGEEIVCGVKFYYGDAQRMTVYRDGAFYDLHEAFRNGFLTVEDLQSLQKVYRQARVTVFSGDEA